MKLIIFSDSHERTDMLEIAAQHVEKNHYDHIIHLGDFRRDAEWLEKRLGREVISVPGNCDFFSPDPREKIMNFDGAWVMLTHGDAYGVKRSYDRLSYHAEEQLCKAVFFGHTHQSFVDYAGSLLMVNPGSLMNGRCAEATVENGSIYAKIVQL